MDIHQEFTEWAVARGVKINGIAAHKFPGRGLGIIAEKRFKAGDILLTVPHSALRTVQTVPKSISKPIFPITVHGLLAAELALDPNPSRAPWRAVLPTKDDFSESMPLMWDPPLQALLPPAALSLLENQKTKLSKDWASVSRAFPALSYDDYLYDWLIVNTRTFYFTSSKTSVRKPVNRDDCMALNPFADYFNHAASGCAVSFGAEGYRITTDGAIEKGEEIYISYGNHSNDFLLAEYGFLLEENRWDEVHLDEFILPFFSKSQKEKLAEAGFLGRYVLDRETVCYRTQVALRLTCMPVGRWQNLVESGLENTDIYQVAVDRVLLKALNSFVKIVDGKLDQVQNLDCGRSSQRETLSRRWKQIRLLLSTGISRIEP